MFISGQESMNVDEKKLITAVENEDPKVTDVIRETRDKLDPDLIMTMNTK